MKKLLYLISFMLLFSCEKPINESAKQCWVCITTKSGITWESVKTCDILIITKMNGRHWVESSGNPAIVYLYISTCKEIN